MNEPKEPLFHVLKRANVPTWQTWVIRLSAIVISILICSLLAFVILGASPLKFIGTLFDGAFGSELRIWKLIKGTAILAGIALALVPAFRMHFWNTGAEGQVLIGMLSSVACIMAFKDSIPNGLLVLLMFIASVCGGMLWGFIPAFFKANWNTNETLFTLMMNYVAAYLVRYFLIKWTPNGSSTIGRLNYGMLPTILNDYLLVILIVLVMVAIMHVYLNYSKHGYEISVVGESVNTARYIGINVKRVIIRTMCVSGAICGIVGFLIVSGLDHSITAESVGGQGFTAIMVAWMANFNPFLLLFSSFLVSFLNQGSGQIQTVFNISDAFPSIVIGIVLFFVIGCEFFINYRIVFRKKEDK